MSKNEQEMTRMRLFPRRCEVPVYTLVLLWTISGQYSHSARVSSQFEEDGLSMAVNFSTEFNCLWALFRSKCGYLRSTLMQCYRREWIDHRLRPNNLIPAGPGRLGLLRSGAPPFRRLHQPAQLRNLQGRDLYTSLHSSPTLSTLWGSCRLREKFG
jgi:hypothetical protein